MIFRLSLSVFALFFQYTGTSEILRPRGVALSKASLYVPDKDFTCFDGSLTIPFAYVNDDYCDCEDGSDEPGTPACPNGTFHCTNAGHKPQNIPSSRVNDGICDCCDTSDEYESHANCVNNCNDLGKAARMEAQKLAEVAKIGSEMRAALSRKGKQLRQEKQERLVQLEKDKEEAESLKKEKEALKLAAEELENKALEKYRQQEEEEKKVKQEEEQKAREQEAFEHFHRLDANQDGKLQKSEIQTQQTFDQNKDGVVSDDEVTLFFDTQQEMDWDEFLATGWPRMRPLLLMNSGMFKPPTAESPDSSDTHEEIETLSQEDSAALDEEHEGKSEDSPKYDEDTQRLVDEATRARSEFEEADRNLRDVQREIKQLQESMEKDYGEEDEFAPLDGECFEFTDSEYVYKLCPFDHATQRSKSGGSETRLGQWNQWSGPEENKYKSMLYDRGQSCWNGPQRSALVKLICGTENSIRSVSEPNRCEYVFEFVTPSICQLSEHHAHAHEEL
ncbi:glucosidase 2 subunit beta isoform X2 [Schistocerca nitens]|uniref:glucosidase 2 subunit beta isoform X2 n=1 Tax=Schistocerca nitens TaxID=7011 RepID=UPI002119233A|nr:glucosidase 2 subunit beta isoform X2 [Schistocerca nitens]